MVIDCWEWKVPGASYSTQDGAQCLQELLLEVGKLWLGLSCNFYPRFGLCRSTVPTLL